MPRYVKSTENWMEWPESKFYKPASMSNFYIILRCLWPVIEM